VSVTQWGNVTLTVEAGFSAATGSSGVWDVSVWNTGTWGPDVVWSDITQYTRAFSTKIGRSREFDHYSAGTASVVLNNRDARFSPENTTGPYATAGITGVRPWRPLRIKAAFAGITYPVFYGFIESFRDEFPGTKDARVIVTCVDGIALLAAFDGYEQAAVGADEPAGVRLHRIADNAMWDLPRAFDSSGTLVQATTLAQNAWGEMLLTADSDGGEIWQDPDGTLIFEHAGSPFERTRETTVQATFTDGVGLMRYADIELAYDGDLLVNVAKLARAGGTQQTAADNTSRALYGEHLFSRSDLVCNTDTQALSLASRMVTLRAQPELRVKSITIQPRKTPATLWPQVLGRRIRDRIHINRTVPGTAVTLSRDRFIDGIEHAATPNSWTTVLRTSSAEQFASAGELGLWNTARWDEHAFGF
jgi:hypothetical protein